MKHLTKVDLVIYTADKRVSSKEGRTENIMSQGEPMGGAVKFLSANTLSLVTELPAR